MLDLVRAVLDVDGVLTLDGDWRRREAAEACRYGCTLLGGDDGVLVLGPGGGADS